MRGVVKGSQYQDLTSGLTRHTGVRTEHHGAREEHPHQRVTSTNLDGELRHEESETISKLGRKLAASLSKDEPRQRQEHEARRTTTTAMEVLSMHSNRGDTDEHHHRRTHTTVDPSSYTTTTNIPAATPTRQSSRPQDDAFNKGRDIGCAAIIRTRRTWARGFPRGLNFHLHLTNQGEP